MLDKIKEKLSLFITTPRRAVTQSRLRSDPESYCKNYTHYGQRQSPELIEWIIAWTISPRNDPLWQASWARSIDEYEKRSHQICGMTSLQTILDYRWITPPWNVTLAQESLPYGCYLFDDSHRNGPLDYGISPLYHKPLCRFVEKEYWLDAYPARSLRIADICRLLSEGNDIILSINVNIREPQIPKNHRSSDPGIHMVVLTWFTVERWQITSISYHNPSGYTENNSHTHFTLPTTIAASLFTGRAIIFR